MINSQMHGMHWVHQATIKVLDFFSYVYFSSYGYLITTEFKKLHLEHLIHIMFIAKKRGCALSAPPV